MSVDSMICSVLGSRCLMGKIGRFAWWPPSGIAYDVYSRTLDREVCVSKVMI